ncbi:MAG: hydrogenase maturation protease [Candidatus Zipacnadales bacterium]
MVSQGADHKSRTSSTEADRRTLIVGLGNPILRDDAIGLHVARALAERLPKELFEIIEADVSGLRLLLLLDGWDRVVIIDALYESGHKGREPQPGRLHRLSLDQLGSTLTLNTSHEASLNDTLELGRQIGMHVPGEITIFGIEVADPFTFDEQMDPELAKQVELLAESIQNYLLPPSFGGGQISPWGCR